MKKILDYFMLFFGLTGIAISVIFFCLDLLSPTGPYRTAWLIYWPIIGMLNFWGFTKIWDSMRKSSSFRITPNFWNTK